MNNHINTQTERNCHMTSFNYVRRIKDKSSYRIVHGVIHGKDLVTGNKVPIKHVWVESGNKVIEIRNRSKVVTPLNEYYKTWTPTQYKKYTWLQAKKKWLENIGHWNFWHEMELLP